MKWSTHMQYGIVLMGLGLGYIENRRKSKKENEPNVDMDQNKNLSNINAISTPKPSKLRTIWSGSSDNNRHIYTNIHSKGGVWYRYISVFNPLRGLQCMRSLANGYMSKKISIYIQRIIEQDDVNRVLSDWMIGLLTSDDVTKAISNELLDIVKSDDMIKACELTLKEVIKRDNFNLSNGFADMFRNQEVQNSGKEFINSLLKADNIKEEVHNIMSQSVKKMFWRN